MRLFKIFALIWLFMLPGALRAGFEIVPSSCGIGKSFFVAVSGRPGLKKIEVSFMDSVYSLFPDKGLYSNYLGVSLKAAPGAYVIEYAGDKKNIVVFEIPYPSETILVEKKELLDEKQILLESGLIGRALKKVNERKRWKSGFIFPVEYTRISSVFGSKRVYNDGRLAWQHKGIDFVNKENTPVVAPASGLVVFSKRLKVHGNTIIIDHGQGIHTIYNHLNRRSIKENQKVTQGMKIGLLGKTGMVTGPHLHFGLSVNNIRVDPADWLER